MPGPNCIVKQIDQKYSWFILAHDCRRAKFDCCLLININEKSESLCYEFRYILQAYPPIPLSDKQRQRRAKRKSCFMLIGIIKIHPVYIQHGELLSQPAAVKNPNSLCCPSTYIFIHSKSIFLCLIWVKQTAKQTFDNSINPSS